MVRGFVKLIKFFEFSVILKLLPAPLFKLNNISIVPIHEGYNSRTDYSFQCPERIG